MNGKHRKIIAAALGMAILILDSRAAASAAEEAVEICIKTVIPSLFPFFLLSGYLTGALSGGKHVAKLFRADENCGGVILTGLLAGYPVGAKLASEEVHSGRILKVHGDRLLWFCSQAGPSFLFGMVAAQFDSMKYVWLLWAVQILSALSVAWIVPEVHGSSDRNEVFLRKSDPMRTALTAMASVCGWVTVFSVVIRFLKRWILWLLPENAQILLCGILELTNGCLRLGAVSDISLRFLLAAVMLNFGGLCVLMQTASVSNGLDMRGYIFGKGLQTLFAVLYSLLIMGHFAAIAPFICLILAKTIPNSRKRSSIPGLNGV